MTTAIDLLFRIRFAWIQTAGQALARGENLRHSVAGELSRFYDLMTEAVATGDPGWMEPFLQGWLDAQASSEVVGEEDEPPSLVPVVHVLRQVTYQTGRESLSDEEFVVLTTALDTILSHAVEFIARHEVQDGIERATSELREVQDALERLDRSKSNFIAVAAHELKTPLTLIEGYSKMLEDLLDHGDARSDAMVNGIDNGLRRLKEIINDMIDVSMIDNNLMSLHYQPVWLNRLIETAVDEMMEAIQARGLTMEIVPFPGSNEMTYADPERLLQAILNIIRNAVKYTPDGGRIHIDGRKLPGFIEITVSDTGIGIALEDQGRIFEKFGRLGNPALHSSGKTKFMGGGPGLGLPIAKGILEAHGGAIWVESPGYSETTYPGSTFHLMVPLRKAAPDDKSAKLFGALEEEPAPN